jgi:carbamoyltransferase
VIGYRFVPNLKARVPFDGGGYLTRTNDAGFRSERAFARARTNGMRRVLLFGDSYSAADGVSNPNRYSDLVEQSVANLEVYNFALPGTGTDQQYLVWRELAAGIEHDLVVIAIFVENIRRVAARYRVYFDDAGKKVVYAKPYYTLANGELALHHVPPQRQPVDVATLSAEDRAGVDEGGRFALLRQVATAIGAKEFLQRHTHYQPLPEYDSADVPAWQLMRAILAKWIGEIGASRALLMPLPLHHYVEELADAAPYQARFAELARDLGCALHDPLPDLLRYSAEERRRFRFEKDPHPTPEGHRAIAASLQPVLERMLPSTTN